MENKERSTNDSKMIGGIVQSKNGKPRKRRSKKVFEENQDINRKITDYFELRRSNRKPSNVIQKEEEEKLCKSIESRCNEKLLEVFVDEVKGRGIRTRQGFKRNEFVVEYIGEIVSSKVAKMREKEYACDSSIGSFMYYFKYRNNQYCVDASTETSYKGRLINHSFVKPNLFSKIVQVNNQLHLIFLAKRDIVDGEELLYDYGDRNFRSVLNNPWLRHS